MRSATTVRALRDTLEKRSSRGEVDYFTCCSAVCSIILTEFSILDNSHCAWLDSVTTVIRSRQPQHTCPESQNIIVSSGSVGLEQLEGRTCGVNRAVRNNLERWKGSGGDRGNSGDSCWWTGAETKQEQDWESTRALGRPISFNNDDVNWSVVFRSHAGLPRTPLPVGVACHHGIEQEEMEGKEEFPLRYGCTSARTRSGRTDQPWDVKVVLQVPQNNRSIFHNGECRTRVESAMRDDAVGAERHD